MTSADPTVRARGWGRGRSPRGRGRSLALGSAAVAAGAALAALVLSAGGLIATWATFTDSAGLVTGSFTAATVAPPTSVGCTTVGDEGYIVWAAPAGTSPTSYVLTYESNKEFGTITYPAGTTQGQPPSPTVPGNRLYTVTVTAVYGSWSTESVFSATIRGHNRGSGTDWSC